MRWQGFAASGVVIVFVGCYTISYARTYEPYLRGTQRSDVSSRVRARIPVCAADQVFEGRPDNFRIVAEAGCSPATTRPPGDFGGVLQHCEAAVVDVRIDRKLRAPHLAVGQTVEFRVHHARLNVDDIRRDLSGARMRFLTREQSSNGSTTYVSASRWERGYERVDVEDDSSYTLGLLAQCPRQSATASVYSKS